MESLAPHIAELFTLAGLIALANIILIDLVMSGDNAILIGMATKDLPHEIRKKAIVFGVALATILRIVLAVFAVFLLKIPGVSFFGGLLLLLVVWNFYKDVRFSLEHDISTGVNKKTVTFWGAISTIILADVSMSLDNVLAVAGASQENIVFLGIGLVVSILLMALASNFIASRLEKYPQIQWLGLFVIIWVSFRMVTEGLHDLTAKTAFAHASWLFMMLLAFVFTLLHTRVCYTLHKAKAASQIWGQKAAVWGVSAFGVALVAVFLFQQDIFAFYATQPALFYSLAFGLLAVLLESINAFVFYKKVFKN